MSSVANRAIAKKEWLCDVAGRDLYRVNNKHDEKYNPFPPSRIVQRVEELVDHTADRARGRKSAGGSQTLPCGPRAAGGQRAFRARPLEACRPVGGFGVRDGLKMGLLSMGFRLSGPNWLLHRGDRNPPAGPHWAATA